MRTSTLILSLTTATFAMTTAYLARELHERDSAAEVQVAGPTTREDGALAAGHATASPATSATAHRASGMPADATPSATAGGTPTTPAAGEKKRADANDPGTITLVPTGPLTNIALAMSKEPRIVERVKRVVLMGGA